jgi:hypothetical protein
MKRILLAVPFLLGIHGAGMAQFAPTTDNLQGLTGVGLYVMFARPDGVEEAQRPDVLKMVEADVTAKLQQAGIPLFRYAGEIKKAGYPRLIVVIRLKTPNGVMYPIVTEVKLYQKVKLARDPSIETDAVTWQRDGYGGPDIDIARLRRLVASGIDLFINDYFSVNPKQAAKAGKDKSKATKVRTAAVVR